MKRLTRITMLTVLVTSSCISLTAQQKYVINGIDMTKVEYEQFKNPDREFRGVRFIGLPLDNISDSLMKAAVHRDFNADKWGSFIMIAGGGSTEGLTDDYLRLSGRKAQSNGVAYLSDEYFRIYKNTIDEGLKLGFRMSTLYDEWAYPSGMVEGLFYSKYPQDCAKSIELEEANVYGKPGAVTIDLPENGIYIGSVLMNLDSRERTDISKHFNNGKLTYKVPKGNWKVMLFYLDPAFTPRSQKGGFVDYLDSDAVAKYINLNFEPYYQHLKEYFGTVIRRTFYDEPTMLLNNGRMWTPKFNEGFEKRYGYNPMTLYPALWYDIGDDTAAARNALHKYRAELFSENYIGQVSKWCDEHNIQFGGHLDQEETRNPVGANGDLMKVFKYQTVPATDDIYYPGRSNVAYKIVSSAAYNYDRPEMFTETFAAYSRPQYNALNPKNYMRVSLDQLAMGVNIQIEFENKFDGIDYFLGRGGYMMRGGRHVADIAMIYPIAALQTAYTFSGKETNGHYYAYMGGVVPAEIDYMDVGESIFRGLHLDYTYIHPEVLTEKCTVEGNELMMHNTNNWERYKILILPGGDTFSADAAKRVLEFYRNGGTVIATSKLPSKSAEFGRDQEIKDMVYEVFGLSDILPMKCQVRHASYRFMNIFSKKNDKGGMGYFLPHPYTSALEEVINQSLPVKDVDMQTAPEYYVKMDHDYEGGITYTHKVRGGKDIYYFANSTDNPLETTVAVRGAKTSMEAWNPHTGERSVVTATVKEKNGEQITEFALSLPAVSGMFFVGE